MNITVTQTNPLPLVLPHLVSNPVIRPAMAGNLLDEMALPATIHELLFKVVKDSEVFWVGAAVPVGTLNFSKVQVFFHPTVVQGNEVRAKEADYPAFTGGWSGALQRYVALEGGQLAAVRQLPMLVPFTTMAALGGGSKNLFAQDPVATLSHITAAIQATLIPLPLPPPNLTDVGVASFSSGITAMRMFINAMRPSRIVREVIDFDSPFIIGEPAALTPSPGAVSSCYSQVPPANPAVAGYRFLPAASFGNLRSHEGNPHACIGFMLYHTAMITSALA